jgi:hypothetical protein
MSICLYTDRKVKLPLCLTNKALRHGGVWGSGCIDPYFLDLGTSYSGVVSFTLRPLYLQGKSSRYSLDRRLGGPRSLSRPSGRCGEEKIAVTQNIAYQKSRQSLTLINSKIGALFPLLFLFELKRTKTQVWGNCLYFLIFMWVLTLCEDKSQYKVILTSQYKTIYHTRENL